MTVLNNIVWHLIALSNGKLKAPIYSNLTNGLESVRISNYIKVWLESLRNFHSRDDSLSLLVLLGERDVLDEKKDIFSHLI